MVEVLLAAGLSLVVAGAAGWMIVSTFGIGDKTRQNISSQTELNQALYRIRSLASLAVNVRFFNGPINNVRSQNSEGYVRALNYRTFADGSGFPDIALMYFNTETRTSAIDATLASRPRPVAVFFRQPTKDPGSPQSAPGKILVVTRQDSGPLVPSQAQMTFDGVVGVSLLNPQYGDKGVMERISLEVTTRFFLVNDNNLPRIWCPPQETRADCQGGAPYRDVTREIILSFDNNQREVRFSSFEFGSGTYLFVPAVGR